MRADERLLVIDTGSSSIRGVLYSRRGELLHLERETYSPDFTEENHVEQDARVWREGLIRVIQGCIRADEGGEGVEGGRIAAAVLTSARSSVIPLDASGNPIGRALMWRDGRTDDICREFEDEQSLIYSRTGITMNSVVSAAKMIWFRRERPEVYENAGKLAGIQDYLIHCLTGVMVTDHSFAGRTGLMNLESRCWDSDMIELFGLDRTKLCELIEPGCICGGVTEEASRLTGLRSGTPVISAGGDQQCAALGAGIIEAGRTGVNTGTGAYVLEISRHPVLDPNRRVFCGAAALPRLCMIEAGVESAGSLYDWFVGLFSSFSPFSPRSRISPGGSRPDTRRDTRRRINRAVEDSPAGANGVVLAAKLNSCASGAFLNLRPGTTAGDMARAVLEGIACELKDALELMGEGGAGGDDAVRSSGGMSKFPLYNQILADVFGRDVLHGDWGESTALGAWVSAASSLGFYADARSAYNEAVSSVKETRFSPRRENTAKYEGLRAFRRSIGTLPKWSMNDQCD